MHEMIGNGWRNNLKDFSEFLIGNLFRIRKSTTNASLQNEDISIATLTQKEVGLKVA